MSALNGNCQVELFDGLVLDLAEGCVKARSGEPVHLRPQTYQVLTYLVENRGLLISKDKLIEEVWKGRAVTDGSLGKCIEELRAALGPMAPEFLRNVRGRGYILGIAETPPRSESSRIADRLDLVRVTTIEENEELPAPAAKLPASRSGVFVMVAGLAITLTLVGAALYWARDQIQKSGNAAAVPFREMDISRLTTSGKVTHAAISPDGRYIASITADADGDSLWVRHITAPTSVLLAGPSAEEFVSVTFAPDSSSVYYLTLGRDKGETLLLRVPVLGGPSSVVAKDVGPVSFSPDARQMAFVRSNSSESRLMLANFDGTDQRTLAIRQDPEVFRVDWNAPAWSPEGSTIACQARLRDDRGMYETAVGVSVADGSQRALADTRWRFSGQPAWLGDGSGLLLTASESSAAPVQVWHISLATGKAARVTNDLNDYFDLSLTRDGGRMSVVQNSSVSRIWVAGGVNARDPIQIASEAGWIGELAWTPDGRIVYRSNAGGSSDIWIMDSDGSHPKQLTVDARPSRGLTISPDGRHIFFSSDRASRFNIWRVDADGSNLTQLTHAEDEFYPYATPNGLWVVFQRGEMEPRLFKVPVDGGDPVQLLDTRAVRPAVSPDGSLIAYHYLDPELERSQWSMGVVSSDGGPRLNRFIFPPAATGAQRLVRWAPPALSIAFTNSVEGVSNIWVRALEGPSPRQLTTFTSGQILAFEWSHDGQNLAVIQGEKISDAVLIEQRSASK